MFGVDITPEAVLAAALELDLVADRLAAAHVVSAAATHVLPSGVDEVSLLAANHFNRGAVTHDQAVAQAVLELHHAAATLRMQLATHVGEDILRASVMKATEMTLGL
ncbi:PE family protein [Nocardia sp. NPDC057440]|uniref:PE family protein n=1 Tax=Nocardia sp. NPDC057440 TaxID=3346134 RepID=UPI003670EB62